MPTARAWPFQGQVMRRLPRALWSSHLSRARPAPLRMIRHHNLKLTWRSSLPRGPWPPAASHSWSPRWSPCRVRFKRSRLPAEAHRGKEPKGRPGLQMLRPRFHRCQQLWRRRRAPGHRCHPQRRWRPCRKPRRLRHDSRRPLCLRLPRRPQQLSRSPHPHRHWRPRRRPQTWHCSQRPYPQQKHCRSSGLKRRHQPWTCPRKAQGSI
mmetsp:Transcript_55848/g.179255  ORF Transcript_55848/g.179255 Transcript_55848/m.179255 type:complete len:208 (+) Transcript_55848:869-1492(+)